MTDLRTRANDDAQRAFKRLLDYAIEHGTWHHALLADWHAAEATFDETPEWMLDAQFDAVMRELDELEDEERDRLPDIPLAWTPFSGDPSEILQDYWNRGQ